MLLKDKSFKIFIPHEEILAKANALGEAISKDYAGKELLFIAVLNGSFMFASDLMKSINVPAKISFIKLSSYEAMSRTGEIKEMLGLQESVVGKNIIIIEDIVDTGHTISHTLDYLKKKQVESVAVVTLLYKPKALQKKVDVKYVGFEIPNAFVVGYGLDYDGYGRNLKDLYQLAE